MGIGATSEVGLSPILVRPVREQLEHDRVIRLLQAKYKKKYKAGINPGAEQALPVGPTTAPLFPDVVLESTGRSRKLLGVIEVETGESINHLEAMSQWARLGRLRVPFQLYVPAGSIDTTRRLCADYKIAVDEIWTFHYVGDEMRFTLIQKSPQKSRRRTTQVAAAPRGGRASARTTVKKAATRSVTKKKGATGTSKPARKTPKASPKPTRKTSPRPSKPARKTSKASPKPKSKKASRPAARTSPVRSRRSVKRG
jgi:hypothetical protein